MVDSESIHMRKLPQEVLSLVEKKKKEIEKTISGLALQKEEKITSLERLEAHKIIHSLCMDYENVKDYCYFDVFEDYKDILKKYIHNDLLTVEKEGNEAAFLENSWNNWQKYKIFAKFMQGLFWILTDTDIPEIRKPNKFEYISKDLYYDYRLQNDEYDNIINTFADIAFDTNVKISVMKGIIEMSLELRRDRFSDDMKTIQNQAESKITERISLLKQKIAQELEKLKEKNSNETESNEQDSTGFQASIKNLKKQLDEYEERINSIFSGGPPLVQELHEEMMKILQGSIGSTVFPNTEMREICLTSFGSTESLWEIIYSIFKRNPDRLKVVARYFKENAVKKLTKEFETLVNDLKGHNFSGLSHEARTNIFKETIAFWDRWSQKVRKYFLESEKEFILKLREAFEEMFSSSSFKIAELMNYQLRLILSDAKISNYNEDQLKKECMELLPLLPNVDHFLALYFMEMLQRMLTQSSAGYLKELEMIGDLEKHCGGATIQKLRKTLLSTIQISEDNAKFRLFYKRDPKGSKEFLKLYVNNFLEEDLDFIKDEVQVELPPEIRELQSLYYTFHEKTYPSRVLKWVYSFSTVLVFQKKQKREILLHFYQYLILSQLEGKESVTISQIIDGTGLDKETIINCLKPMVFSEDQGKALLMKIPNVRQFSLADQVIINEKINPGSNYYEIEPPPPNKSCVELLGKQGLVSRDDKRDSGGKTFTWIVENYTNELYDYAPSEEFIRRLLDDLVQNGFLVFHTNAYEYSTD